MIVSMLGAIAARAQTSAPDTTAVPDTTVTAPSDSARVAVPDTLHTITVKDSLGIPGTLKGQTDPAQVKEILQRTGNRLQVLAPAGAVELQEEMLPVTVHRKPGEIIPLAIHKSECVSVTRIAMGQAQFDRHPQAFCEPCLVQRHPLPRQHPGHDPIRRIEHGGGKETPLFIGQLDQVA